MQAKAVCTGRRLFLLGPLQVRINCTYVLVRQQINRDNRLHIVESAKFLTSLVPSALVMCISLEHRIVFALLKLTILYKVIANSKQCIRLVYVWDTDSYIVVTAQRQK